jgi:hypothetical protein
MPGTRRLSECRLIIGIPTVRRQRDYLLETVDSLVANIPRRARARVEIVVFNADVPPEMHARVGELATRHAELVDAGFLRILTNPHGHPELSRGPAVLATHSSDAEKQAWQTKLTLDATYLMRYAAARGAYYLHVEDDFVAAEGFYDRLEEWFDRNFAARDDWGMLAIYAPYDFQDCQRYPLGQFFSFSGMLFRSEEVPALAEALRSRYRLLPLDLLVAERLSEADRAVYVCVPSLFQNMGLVSTWHHHKVGLSRSPTFPEPAAARRIARDLREVVDIIRYRRRAIWRVLRHRVYKPRWLQRLVDGFFDRALSLRRKLYP